MQALCEYGYYAGSRALEQHGAPESSERNVASSEMAWWAAKIGLSLIHQGCWFNDAIGMRDMFKSGVSLLPYRDNIAGFKEALQEPDRDPRSIVPPGQLGEGYSRTSFAESGTPRYPSELKDFRWFTHRPYVVGSAALSLRIMEERGWSNPEAEASCVQALNGVLSGGTGVDEQSNLILGDHGRHCHLVGTAPSGSYGWGSHRSSSFGSSVALYEHTTASRMMREWEVPEPTLDPSEIVATSDFTAELSEPFIPRLQPAEMSSTSELSVELTMGSSNELQPSEMSAISEMLVELNAEQVLRPDEMVSTSMLEVLISEIAPDAAGGGTSETAPEPLEGIISFSAESSMECELTLGSASAIQPSEIVATAEFECRLDPGQPAMSEIELLEIVATSSFEVEITEPVPPQPLNLLPMESTSSMDPIVLYSDPSDGRVSDRPGFQHSQQATAWRQAADSIVDRFSGR